MKVHKTGASKDGKFDLFKPNLNNCKEEGSRGGWDWLCSGMHKGEFTWFIAFSANENDDRLSFLCYPIQSTTLSL